MDQVAKSSAVPKIRDLDLIYWDTTVDPITNSNHARREPRLSRVDLAPFHKDNILFSIARILGYLCLLFITITSLHYCFDHSFQFKLWQLLLSVYIDINTICVLINNDNSVETEMAAAACLICYFLVIRSDSVHT